MVWDCGNIWSTWWYTKQYICFKYASFFISNGYWDAVRICYIIRLSRYIICITQPQVHKKCNVFWQWAAHRKLGHTSLAAWNIRSCCVMASQQDKQNWQNNTKGLLDKLKDLNCIIKQQTYYASNNCLQMEFYSGQI